MVVSGSSSRSERHVRISAPTTVPREQMIPPLAAVVLVVLFGLARLKSCMGEACVVIHRIVAVARRRLRENFLILLQMRRLSPKERRLDKWIFC